MPETLATAEAAFDTHVGTVRTFTDQEIPEEADWNVNPNLQAAAYTDIADIFADTKTLLDGLRTEIDLEHTAGAHAQPPEWWADAATPSFVGASSFTFVGDRTADYQTGHRIRVRLTGGTLVVVSVLTVTFQAGPNTTTITVTTATNPSPLNSGLDRVEQSAVRFGAPRVRTEDLLPAVVTNAIIATGAVTETKLGALSVTTPKIGALQVTSGKIGANAVIAGKIAANAVDTAAIVDAAVTEAKLGAGAVTVTKLGANAVTAAILADNAVDTAAIVDAAVTSAKLAADLQAGAITVNLVENGSFASWSAGAAAAPDRWALSGTGAVIAKQTAAPTAGQVGVNAAKITAGSAASELAQTVRTISTTKNKHLASRLVTFGCWVYATATSAAAIRVSDGTADYTSTSHSGAAGWEFLTLTVTLAAGASVAQVKLLNQKSDSSTVVFFDGAILVLGDALPNTHHDNPADTTLGAGDFQDDAGVDAVLGNLVAQCGWGWIDVGTTSSTNDTYAKLITFAKAFRTIVGVDVTWLGTKLGGPPADIFDTDAVALNDIDPRDDAVNFSVRGGTLSLTSMEVFMVREKGDDFATVPDDGHYVFSWTVRGILA